MKKSKPTKSNDPVKILRMISRDEELERNDGKWVAMNRAYKNHKKYDRKRDKKVDLDPFSLIIHPADPSTQFLQALYPDWHNSALGEKDSNAAIKRAIRDTPRPMLLGHGTEYGLLCPQGPRQFGRIIVGSDHVYLLREKEYTIGIWCNASQFALKYGLHGLFSQMVVSELEEAVMCSILTSQEEITEMNQAWAEDLGDLIRNYPLPDVPRLMEERERWGTELTRYNWSALEWFEKEKD